MTTDRTNPASAADISGAAIMDELERAGVEFIPALPDITTSDGLLWPLSRTGRFRLIRLCKEDEGVSICSGLAAAGRRAILLMQNTGFLDSANAIRVAVQLEQPVCMLVGLLGKVPDRKPSDNQRYSVQIMEPIIDALRVRRINIETGGDVRLLVPAIEQAYADSRPMVTLLGRPLVP